MRFAIIICIFGTKIKTIINTQIMNRRQFINRSAALLAAGSIVGQDIFAATATKLNKGRIGIQLYSVKDELPKDFEGTLKKLSDTGYSLVEPYGFNGTKFFDRTMKELSVIVNDMGMSISGTHCGARMLPEDTNAPEWDNWKAICTELKSGGGTWAILASLPGRAPTTLDDYKRICAQFNLMGKVCAQNEVKFAFHNHTEVFGKLEGEIIYDYMINNTDPKLVFFQMDLGHTVNAGADCLAYIRKYGNRIPLWHASDYDASSRKSADDKSGQYVEVGKGSVPYKALFALPNTGGLENLTVEQETGGDIFASCKEDFDFLKQFKWTEVG